MKSDFMKIFESVVAEMAAPTDSMRNTTYYHGTTSTAAANSIWKNGLDVKATEVKYGDRRPHLRPAEGRVYITPDIEMAVIYGLGGSMLGHKIPDSWLEKEGRYGYVFQFSGDQLGDVQPDEDEVGKLIMYGMNSSDSWSSKYYENNQLFQKARTSPVVHKMIRLLHDNFSSSTVRKVKDGEVVWHAKVGKRINTLLTDKDKQDLIEMGLHIANQGKMIPSKVYRIDKRLSQRLNKDGSNFFEVAKLVKER